MSKSVLVGLLVVVLVVFAIYVYQTQHYRLQNGPLSDRLKAEAYDHIAKNTQAELENHLKNGASDQQVYDSLNQALKRDAKAREVIKGESDFGSQATPVFISPAPKQSVDSAPEVPKQPVNSPTVPKLPTDLPRTPTSVYCDTIYVGLWCQFPTHASDWVKITTLQPGDIVEADPNGVLMDYWWQKYGRIGPEGLNYLCRDETLRQRLPAPDAPPYALAAKLGVAGRAVALAGRYREPLIAKEAVDLYLRENDLPQSSNECNVGCLEGSHPVIIRRKR